jgi:hypothetical protein
VPPKLNSYTPNEVAPEIRSISSEGQEEVTVSIELSRQLSRQIKNLFIFFHGFYLFLNKFKLVH